MAKLETITGLDMGSGRVTCVIGTPDPEGQGIRILGGSSVPCRGLKGGFVLNIHETARAVRAAVEKAEEQAQQLVHGVYLGVRGKHLQAFNNRGAYNIARTDKEITQDDVQAVIETAKAIPISNDREILHIIPQSFALDRQPGVPDPVGMEGSLLEVDVHIVHAASSPLNNLTKAVAEAGFDVIEPVYGLLALGDFLVSPEEQELGALLVDVGGQTLSVAVYSDGALKFSAEKPLGSDHITKDLAMGLRTNMQIAEKLKIEHCFAHPSLYNGESEIPFKGVDGRTGHTVKPSTLMNIVLPRVEEIFTVVGESVQGSDFSDMVVPGGVIVSGGGSLLHGMADAAAQILQVPARTGVVPGEGIHAPDELLHPTFATALALVDYSQRRGASPASIGTRRSTDPRWMRKLKKFFEDLF